MLVFILKEAKGVQPGVAYLTMAPWCGGQRAKMIGTNGDCSVTLCGADDGGEDNLSASSTSALLGSAHKQHQASSAPPRSSRKIVPVDGGGENRRLGMAS